MNNDSTSTAIKIGSYVSIALGPVLSKEVPMASDLRPWAFWFSAIVSTAVLIWLSVQFAGNPSPKPQAMRALRWCCALAVFFGLCYIAINLVWTTERGDFADVVWQLALIGSFGLSAGSITGALVAVEKLTKH